MQEVSARMSHSHCQLALIQSKLIVSHCLSAMLLLSRCARWCQNGKQAPVQAANLKEDGGIFSTIAQLTAVQQHPSIICLSVLGCLKNSSSSLER